MPSRNYPTYHNKVSLGSYFSYDGIGNYSNTPKPSQVGSISRTWMNTPGYFGLISGNGMLHTRDYEFVSAYEGRCFGTQEVAPLSSPSQWRRLNGVIDDSKVGVMFIPNAPAGAATISTLVDRALVATSADLLSRIKSQKVNLAQSFAEVNQTANLVSDTLRRVILSARRAKSGDIVGAVRALGADPSKATRRRARFMRSKKRLAAEDFSENWLSIQYGWLPLYSDVYGSAVALAAHNSRPRYTSVYVKKRITDELTLKSRKTGFNDALTIVDVYDYQMLAKQSVKFYITNNAAKSASEIGVSNPSLLAWELIPFSFVADWFLPIGNFLSAFDATAGLHFYDGALSFAVTQNLNSKVEGITVNAGSYGTIVYSGEVENYAHRTVMVRRQITTWPTNRFPDFEPNLNLRRTINGISLAIQRLKTFG